MDAPHPSMTDILEVVSGDSCMAAASFVAEHVNTCPRCNLLALQVARGYALCCLGAKTFSVLLGICVRPQALMYARRN